MVRLMFIIRMSGDTQKLAIIEGKIESLIQRQDALRFFARFVPKNNPADRIEIPITREQWSALPCDKPVKLIVEIQI